MNSAEPQVVQFKLRITPELKRRIEEAAAANGRSVNREATARLESSLNKDGGTSNSANAKILEQIGSILAAASAAAEPDWTDDHVAWDLLRSTVDHLFRGWEPLADEEAKISDAAKRAFEQWQNATGAAGKSPADLDAEVRELELRKEVIGLTATEVDRLKVLETVGARSYNFDGLNSADREALKRKIRDERIRTEFWRRVAPLFSAPPGAEKFRPKVFQK